LHFLCASRPTIVGQVGSSIDGSPRSLAKRRGFAEMEVQTGAVTLIQRFGSALNLNVHFHRPFLDGVYRDGPDGSARFRQLWLLQSKS
jgi:hypothetical protein